MNFHIVEFEQYCPKCKHYEKSAAESPCWECLDQPVNEDSKRPLYFEEGETKSQKKQSV